MKKKIFIIITLLVGVVGGFILAQYNISGKAQIGSTIDANEAKEIALKEVNGEIVEFEYDNDGLFPHYEVEVVKDNEKVDMDIDAKTGKVKITDRELVVNKTASELIEGTTDKQTAKQNQGTTNKQPNNQGQATNGNLITQNKAVSIASNKVGGGTVTDVELDRDNGVYVFEVEVYKDNVEYDIDVNATTGEAIIIKEERKSQVQQNNGQAANAQTISLDKAISIATKKAGGGKVVDAKLDMDEGIKVYDVEIINGNTEFDFEIDAVTGKILKLEKETFK